jgi:hypothetical protein
VKRQVIDSKPVQSEAGHWALGRGWISVAIFIESRCGTESMALSHSLRRGCGRDVFFFMAAFGLVWGLP